MAHKAVPHRDTIPSVDHGLTGRNKERPRLREALAAVRAGETHVVTKLDRLARDILEVLTKRKVKLSIGGPVHDPTDPAGRLLFNVLAVVAEFESDVIRERGHHTTAEIAEPSSKSPEARYSGSSSGMPHE